MHLGNYPTFFPIYRYITTEHTVPDCAFIKNQVRSSIFTPKMVTYTLLCFELKSTTALTGVCTLVRDANLEV